MKKTATVHNPTNFEPAHYEVLDYLDNKRPQYCGGPAEAWKQEVEAWQADMVRTFGADYVRKIHHCIHCGNGNVRWITAVLHRPTNEVVVFGSDCTERLGFENRQAWKLAQLKSKAEAGHARLKVWNQRVAFLEANPDVVVYIEQAKQPVHQGNTFVQDVLSKLDRFGSLSVNQVNAVGTSLKRDIERAAQAAIEATEVKGEAPEGRAEVTGKVLTIKVQEGFYGTQTKMLLKLDNNSKVWLTAPLAFNGDGTAAYHAGDTITVRATFTRKAEDIHFAFGKRPHFVKVVAAEGAVQ